MFTGIVEELGHVVSLAHGPDSAVVRIRGPLVTADAAPGASIAVNGLCLTVVELDADSFDKPKTWLFNIKGEQAANDLRDNFIKSPYFTNVTLGKVMTSSSSDYPYTIEVTATMKKSIAQ